MHEELTILADDVPDLIRARRDEVAFYDANIEMCVSLLAVLPGEWPEHLVALRNATSKHEAAASIEKLEDVEVFARLILRDETEARLRAETFERAKANAALTALVAERYSRVV